MISKAIYGVEKKIKTTWALAQNKTILAKANYYFVYLQRHKCHC
jgi:hypothetical protein